MSKYTILDGSIDMDDGSLATHDGNYKNVKYMKGDILAAFKAAAADQGCKTLGEAMSWQREQLEAGKPGHMAFLKIGGI